MPLPKRYRPYRRQARTQGRLQFGPEQQTLNRLGRDERRTMLDTIDSQNSAATAIALQAEEGGQDIRDIYENAGLTDAVRESLASNPAARRLAEEMAAGEVEMEQRAVDAREGAAFATRQAVRDYRRDIKRINEQKTDLARRKGLFVSTLLEQLIGEDKAARAAVAEQQQQQAFEMTKLGMQLGQQERNSIRSAGIDPDTNKPLSTTKKTTKKATGADREAAAALGKAKTWLDRLDNDGYRTKVPSTTKRREALGELLTAGDRESGVPALPQHIVEAALDMHFRRRLSPATVKMLRSLGIQVRRLPGVQFGPRPTTGATGNMAPGPNGQSRPT